MECPECKINGEFEKECHNHDVKFIIGQIHFWLRPSLDKRIKQIWESMGGDSDWLLGELFAMDKVNNVIYFVQFEEMQTHHNYFLWELLQTSRIQRGKK